MQDINNLITQAKTHVAGQRESVLDQDTRTQLDAFVTFLVAEGKSVNTARSYRSYVVTALTCGKEWAELSSDVRSACRALARFSES